MHIGDLSEMKLQMMQMNKMLLESMMIGSEIEGHLMIKDGQLVLDTKAGIKLPISLCCRAVQMPTHVPQPESISVPRALLFCEGDINLGELLKFLVIEKTNEEFKLQLIPREDGDLAPLQTKELTHKVIEDLNLPRDEVSKALIEGFVEKQFPLERSVLLKSFYIHKMIQLPVPVIINFLETKGELKEAFLKPLQEIRANGGKTVVVSQVTQLIQSLDLSKETCYRLLNVLGVDQIESIAQSFKLRTWIIQLIEENMSTSYERLKKLPETERGKMLQQSPELEKIVEILEEVGLPKEAKMAVATIKENLNQLNNLQDQGQMLCMPFNYKEHLQDVEVYLFKPKKKHPKSNQELYVVVALDMPALDQVEIHIHQVEKALMIGIQVCDIKVQKHFQKHMMRLGGELEKLGYVVKQVAVSIKQDHEDQIPIKQFASAQISKSFDYKV